MDEAQVLTTRGVTPLRAPERTPPHSDEAEISVLGGMLIEETAADYAMEKLVEDDFYHPAHRLIFEAIQRLRDQGHAPDALAVREELQRHGDLAADRLVVRLRDRQAPVSRQERGARRRAGRGDVPRHRHPEPALPPVP